ncbi:hypothetical protein [Cohnella silvisoli]|uniref:Uncharacterized protein n=1 Tax=Cohnella silvisoli TaxID=2873699 RepID=A0ABV1L2K4_9BACL|nr:hypothetical protein [Cohnella silvisoli]MCD9025882.1 hypothetical protein [Cohnella silvisoli]
MKKFLSIILIVGLIFTLSTSAFAKDKNTSEGLTEKEKLVLINQVGLTEEETTLYPIGLLRELIANDGKKLSTTTSKSYDLKSEGPSNGEIGTASLTNSDITLNGAAFSTTSDVSGSKKIILVGNFQWKVDPFWTLTDKMSIGYPVTNKWYLRTSQGQVLGHSSETCNYVATAWDCVTKSSPSNYDLGVGVAASFDLKGDANVMKGWVQQYVYVVNTESGTSNVLFRYGHKTISGNVGVGIYPVGLAVEPAVNTETLDYIITFSW